MGVDVVAIFNKAGSPEVLVSHLNDKLSQFDNRQATWVLSADKYYIENESGTCFISVGDKALTVSLAARWYMFCNNINNVQLETLQLLYEVGSVLGASEFLLVPDSSFDEARCIDLLEDECSLSDFENYLEKIGSCRKVPGKITYIENDCWNSHGYMHFSANQNIYKPSGK